MATPIFAQEVGPELAAGIKAVDQWFAPTWPSEFADYVQSKGLAGKVEFTPKTASAYDAAIAILDAYRRAPAPKTGPQLRDELRAVKFAGKGGPVAFDDSGDLAYPPDAADTYVSLIGFQPDGSLKIAATAPPQQPAAQPQQAQLVAAAKEAAPDLAAAAAMPAAAPVAPADARMYRSVAATHEALTSLNGATAAEQAPAAEQASAAEQAPLAQMEPLAAAVSTNTSSN
jgi:hypothetical protein